MRVNESKYKLIVNHVIDGINNNVYKKGDWIPSINEFRKNYNISRDTVFAGLSELKIKGIIDSNPGVGYYITSARIPYRHNIFLLFNELNEFKKNLYNSFMESVGKSANVDIYFHNYNRKVFETLIKESRNKYTTYIVMSGKFNGINPLLQTLSGDVFLLDHFHPELKGIFHPYSRTSKKTLMKLWYTGYPVCKNISILSWFRRRKKSLSSDTTVCAVSAGIISSHTIT